MALIFENLNENISKNLFLLKVTLLCIVDKHFEKCKTSVVHFK